jgi:hypothetical protein
MMYVPSPQLYSTLFESKSYDELTVATTNNIVLDAVGTAEEAAQHLLLSPMTTLSHKYYHWCSEHIKYNHSVKPENVFEA